MNHAHLADGRNVPVFTPEELHVIVHSLRVAADVYNRDIETFLTARNVAHKAGELAVVQGMERSADQFMKQRRAALALAEELE